MPLLLLALIWLAFISPPCIRRRAPGARFETLIDMGAI